MAVFPKIQSPCPYKGELAAIMDGDVCRLCKREVFDLTDMDDNRRVAFMKACQGEICVSYKIPAAAALALAVVATPMAVAAQDKAPAEPAEILLVMGGIKNPDRVEYVETAADKALPALPVVYEDAPVTPSAPVAVKPRDGA